MNSCRWTKRSRPAAFACCCITGAIPAPPTSGSRALRPKKKSGPTICTSCCRARARSSIRFAVRHPTGVRGFLLFRVTGGAFAAGRLPEQYYGQYIRAAQLGGMAAVCDTEQYRERIAANPKNRDVLMAMDPKRYIAVMEHWHKLFLAGANFTIMGVTDDQLRSIKAPTIVIPGNDNTHNSASGRAAQKLIPGSKLHQLPIEDKDVPLISFEEWAPYEAEIAKTFVDFMRGVAGSMAA